MEKQSRFRHILQELLCHSPYTMVGAVAGIAFMLIFRHFGQEAGSTLFRVFHPAHVVLSAMVTASLFRIHSIKKSFITVLLVGYFGSIGIATLSDCVIPFFGEEILGVAVPSHAEIHDAPEVEAGHVHGPDCDHEAEMVAVAEQDEHEHALAAEGEEEPDHAHGSVHDHAHGLHLGFIEEWYLVNPAALLGIFIAMWVPRTRFPHAMHVLVSTWASSAHMLMNTQAELTGMILLGMFVVLFIAVWLPCCVSDIVFPLLFVKGDIGMACRCRCAHHDEETAGEHGHEAVC